MSPSYWRWQQKLLLGRFLAWMLLAREYVEWRQAHSPLDYTTIEIGPLVLRGHRDQRLHTIIKLDNNDVRFVTLESATPRLQGYHSVYAVWL